MSTIKVRFKSVEEIINSGLEGLRVELGSLPRMWH